MASISSVVSRYPAVSMSSNKSPPISMVDSIKSRVVPLISETMARSSPSNWLSNEDFPTFGYPMIRHFTPECINRP